MKSLAGAARRPTLRRRTALLRKPGANLPNLTAYLQSVLKMPVDAAGAHAESATSVSLAAVSRGTLNFLAGGGNRPGFAWIVDAVPAPAVAAAAAILVVSIAAPSEVQTIQARHRVSALRGNLEKLAAQSTAVAAFRSARENEARLRVLEARLTGSPIVWSTLLRDLSHRV